MVRDTTDLKIWIRTFDPQIQWLFKWGLPSTLVFAAIFIFSAFTETLGQTWDLLSGTLSPSQVGCHPHWIAYLVSVEGYIAVPAFIGTVVGVVVSLQKSSYRRPIDELPAPDEG
jgi:hypothetical protein